MDNAIFCIFQVDGLVGRTMLIAMAHAPREVKSDVVAVVAIVVGCDFVEIGVDEFAFVFFMFVYERVCPCERQLQVLVDERCLQCGVCSTVAFGFALKESASIVCIGTKGEFSEIGNDIALAEP